MAQIAALKACGLFKGFTDTGLQILAGISVPRSFPKGTPLFVENMMADSMLIIVSGTVHLSTRLSNQSEVSLGDLGAGEAMGELSLIQQSKRMCTATAQSDVSVVEIRYGEFQKLVALKPQACVKLLMAVVSSFGQRITENREHLRGLLERTDQKR